MPSKNILFDYDTPNTLRIKLTGEWQISSGIPDLKEVISEIAIHGELKKIIFDASGLIKWDSGAVSFLLHLAKECQHRDIQVSRQGLPEGMDKLLTLAFKADGKVMPRKITREPFFEKVADKILQVNESTRSLLDFLGEITVAFGKLISRKAYFRRDDFASIVQKCSWGALPLVSLISLLVGIILAFVGAIQLKMLGAQIFIADIVGIAMVRMMGAVMTGVLMSGRTGASFAAELGIMQTNEEIDALKTLGVSPVEFLVMPRVLALVIMMPLLTLYADFMGILGGFIISTEILGLNPIEYLNHTQAAVKINNLWIGLIHGFVFGIIIAVAACLRGIKCERNAAAVGEATTSAVVTAITWIVIATAVITFVCQVIGV